MQDFSRAIELSPTNAEVYFVRGIIRYDAGDDQACADLSRAGELGYMQSYKIISERCNGQRTTASR